jgi:flagellar basal-body rod modification protein FlgD
MDAISKILNVPGGLTAPQTTTAGGPAGGIDQEGFLRLLVAQLQNQDPLEPLTNEQFVQQLTAFSSLDELREIKEGMNGLEQLGDISQILAANLALQQASVNASTVGLIGNQVEALSDTVQVTGEGGIEIGVTLPESATASIALRLENGPGNVVYETQFSPSNPPEGVRIDGDRVYVAVPTERADGEPMPTTPLQIHVEADTASGTVPLETSVLGAVDGIDFRSENTMITIAGTPVDLINVIAVNRLLQAG